MCLQNQCKSSISCRVLKLSQLETEVYCSLMFEAQGKYFESWDRWVWGRVVISGGGSSFVTIIQTHCAQAQYSGVLVNIKDDTVTQTQAPWHVDWGESHDINIRMLQHQKPPWSVTTSLKCVTSYTSIASIGNFYRIDINSLHFSNHYSLCERQFSFIW